MSSGIHIRANSQERLQLSIPKIHLKITYLKFHSNLPEAIELMAAEHISFVSMVSGADEVVPNSSKQLGLGSVETHTCMMIKHN